MYVCIINNNMVETGLREIHGAGQSLSRFQYFLLRGYEQFSIIMKIYIKFTKIYEIHAKYNSYKRIHLVSMSSLF